MSWTDTHLSDDQREIVDLVESAQTAGIDDDRTGEYSASDEDSARIRAACRILADAGIWSIGMAEDIGGGGAPLELRLTALVALGARHAALAWGCAQAHAAAEVLAGQAGFDDVREGIVDARTPVCVIDRAADHVRLEFTAGRVTGTLERLDPAGEDPYIVVLDGDAAWIIPPGALSAVTSLARTGMQGALTVAATVDGRCDSATARVTGILVGEVRARLHLAGAAIAAGIALDAAERARSYSHSRVQFGALLTELPTVRLALAQQVERAAESLAVLFAGTSPVHAAGALAGNCDRAIDVASSAIQSHGGYGYLQEYEVERLLRDAVSLRAATGSLAARHLAAAHVAGGSRP